MNIDFIAYNVFRLRKIKKIAFIVLTSLLIIPQGIAFSLKSDICIEWIRGDNESTTYCLMKSNHNEASRNEAGGLWIKSAMECCGNVAGPSLYSEFLTNFMRDLQLSVRQLQIPKVSVIPEFSNQANLPRQESLVTTSDPPVKIFKEVNSYII